MGAHDLLAKAHAATPDYRYGPLSCLSVLVVGTTQDITDRVQAEDELHRAQRSLVQSSRLIAMGQMAAAMAHELNQPLTVVSALAEGLQLRLERGLQPSPEQQLDWSGDNLAGIDRMRHIIDHLRAFGRDRHGEAPARLQPRRAIEATLSFVEAQLASRGIALVVELEDLPEITGEAYGIEQVLLNLLTNARDAVEEQARCAPGWPMRVTVRGRTAGGLVVIEVEDNGPGIAPVDRARIFALFFTTKGPGGLGLAICQDIVHRHGGERDVESLDTVPGSRFRVRLPVAPPPPAAT